MQAIAGEYDLKPKKSLRHVHPDTLKINGNKIMVVAKAMDTLHHNLTESARNVLVSYLSRYIDNIY